MVILSPIPIVTLSNQRVKAVTAGVLGKKSNQKILLFLTLLSRLKCAFSLYV